MKLKPIHTGFSVIYEDIHPDDKFDHNPLICNGCVYWYKIYNRCTYRYPGESLYFERNLEYTKHLEKLTCESAQNNGRCPYKKYLRYYDKNYKYFLKNDNDEQYLKMKRKLTQHKNK